MNIEQYALYNANGGGGRDDAFFGTRFECAREFFRRYGVRHSLSKNYDIDSDDDMEDLAKALDSESYNSGQTVYSFYKKTIFDAEDEDEA